MLELYHWEPNGASARVLISLEEKGLAYASRYVNVLCVEQYRAALLASSATAELPVLVSDGAALSEASDICEYLEEAFPATALMPPDARGRWRVRVWQKRIDEGVAASVCELAWHAYAARSRAALDAAQLAARRGRTSSDEELARARERIARALAGIEADLSRTPWLAGAKYSLADIAVFAYFAYLPGLCPELLNERQTPRSLGWVRAIAARPAVRAALARGRVPEPFAVAAPGPEQIRWG
ncbi:MAG TPA: glutathione S-transferase family protein [Steroidobacteraceae bacterium]|nr:glutathione S-transferase family protein [Steroidobacteraceae bacterium]